MHEHISVSTPKQVMVCTQTKTDGWMKQTVEEKNNPIETSKSKELETIPREKNYGFAIDVESCIGCHACSTACKSENEVPLGVYRTWVKYTEVGSFPDSRREFQVTRCNHCANPPCVRICPVTAMYQRNDGIVEFDKDICIGCKACMQACPYDAIHIDPETNTAAKCHYCSHRVDIGLEPACVVVCPTHSIIAGDTNDPDSEISGYLARKQVTVRKPEQGTSPKLFYVGGSDASQHPTVTEREPETFMWADVNRQYSKKPKAKPSEAASTRTSHSGETLRKPQKQGYPDAGALQLGKGRLAEQMIQVAYNAQHKTPWHWPVPAYLVTKGIASGLFLLITISWFLGNYSPQAAVVSGFVALLFVGITTGLLVIDLERPERFLSILYRPQWKSWLTKGAFILIGFSLLLTAWWGLEAAVYFKFIKTSLNVQTRAYWLIAGIPLAIGASIYTAFLFGQAEGRDLWQSPLLPFHLLVQAMMAGSAAYMMIHPFLVHSRQSQVLFGLAKIILISMLILDLFVTLFGEFGMPHASEVAVQAAKEISHGEYKNLFWWGSIALGHVVPLVLLFMGKGILFSVAAGAGTIIGLYCFEHAFVMAPQKIQNS